MKQRRDHNPIHTDPVLVRTTLRIDSHVVCIRFRHRPSVPARTSCVGEGVVMNAYRLRVGECLRLRLP